MKIRYLIIVAGVAVSTASQAQDKTTYTYDVLGRLKDAVSSGSQNTTTEIRYDPAGNRTSYTVTGATDGHGDPGALAGNPQRKRFVVVPLNGFTIIPLQ